MAVAGDTIEAMDPRAPTPDQIADLLRATIATLGAELTSLDRETLAWHPADGEWCVNEVLGHIIEAEQRGFAGQIERIVAEPGRTLLTWDPAAVARVRRDCDGDGKALLQELTAMRAESVRLVSALKPEQMSLAAEHPEVGGLSISDVVHEFVHHDRNHVKQILSNVQAFVWPHMGGAQRFSELDA